MKLLHKPTFPKTLRYFNRLQRFDPVRILHEFGKIGVAALQAGTPYDTGEASRSWSYKVEGNRERYELIWSNSDTISSGTPLVILLQYGHATKDGYFLQGRDFINPALEPVYDALQAAIRGEVLT